MGKPLIVALSKVDLLPEENRLARVDKVPITLAGLEIRRLTSL